MLAVRSWVARPGFRSRAASGALTILALLPVLLRLPKVVVVACVEAGHPPYEWVPNSGFAGDVQCLSAPTPAVSWTLVIAATLLVQLLLLPLLIAVGGVLVRGASRILASAERVLAGVLSQLGSVLAPEQRLVPVPVRSHRPDTGWARQHPRRGPPSRSC